MRAQLRQARRVVIKVGSAVIAPGGVMDDASVRSLAGQVARARRAGVQVTVVSSGAIACGFRSLGLSAPPTEMTQKQAAAAIGQPMLMNAWIRALGDEGLTCAQVLLTGDDVQHRGRYLNARRTLQELLRVGVVPVVNENDSVSFEEIRFGDNDMLSAHVASLLEADLLLILSSATGLYEANDPARVLGHVVVDERAQKQSAAAQVRTDKTMTGVGGMASKLSAVSLAAGWGVATVIAGGRVGDVVHRVLSGEREGTLFTSRSGGVKLRKRWLAAGVKVMGRIEIDDGAARALTQKGASLLPRGVKRVEGEFDRGEPVEIATGAGVVLARGLCAYSSDEARKIAGRRSDEIEELIGYFGGEELVHRDDLVLVEVTR